MTGPTSHLFKDLASSASSAAAGRPCSVSQDRSAIATMCFTDNSPLRFMLREPGRPASLSFQRICDDVPPDCGRMRSEANRRENLKETTLQRRLRKERRLGKETQLGK